MSKSYPAALVETPYLDRAREMNRQQNENDTRLGVLITLTMLSLAITIGGMAFAIGYLLPTGKPAPAYDLIQFIGHESDIVDYDLTFDDCVTAAQQMSAAGLQVTCESAN